MLSRCASSISHASVFTAAIAPAYFVPAGHVSALAGGLDEWCESATPCADLLRCLTFDGESRVRDDAAPLVLDDHALLGDAGAGGAETGHESAERLESGAVDGAGEVVARDDLAPHVGSVLGQAIGRIDVLGASLLRHSSNLPRVMCPTVVNAPRRMLVMLTAFAGV